MECPNCTFQNVPGQRDCARCRSLLDLSGVSVEPMRAGAVALPISMRRAGVRLRSTFGSLAAVRLGSVRESIGLDLDRSDLLRFIIPGWVHFHRGWRVFGCIVTAVWLILCAAALILHGGGGGWTAYFVLLGWHGFAISLALSPSLQRFDLGKKMLAGLAVYASLNLVIYGPALLLLRGFLAPFEATGIMSGPVLADGDVVLRTGRWTRPENFERGELVVYRVNGIDARISDGFGIDRILAVAGDEVVIGPSSVTVNGRLLPVIEGPIRPIALDARAFRVAAGTCLILPSALNLRVAGPAGMREQLIYAVSQVRERDILGRVVLRSRPFSRAGTISYEEPRP